MTKTRINHLCDFLLEAFETEDEVDPDDDEALLDRCDLLDFCFDFDFDFLLFLW